MEVKQKMKPSEKKHYRLGIDMGSTSIGWCMLELDKQNNPCGIINMGVRIFPDGRDDKSKEPLSVSRRTYRGMRRNLDRYLDRRNRILEFFDRNGFLPQQNPERRQVFLKDPVELRKDALDRQITLSDMARAVIHLAKRRGFKSNRKTDKESQTAYSEAIKNLETLLKENARTLGEYLWMRNSDLPKDKHNTKKPIKFRYEKGLPEEERIFPTRAMVEAEFDLIWDTQAKYNPILSPDLKAELKDILFYQRPLRPQEVGKCTLEPEEKRCLKAFPQFQEARLRQDINHLKLVNSWDNSVRDLAAEERETLFTMLNHKEKVTFKAMRKELLGKGVFEEYRFNFETDTKDKLQGNLTNYAFAREKELAPWWQSLNLETQQKVISIILDESLSDESAQMLLIDLGLKPELAVKALNSHLPNGYGNLSLIALNNILPYLRQGFIYSTACEKAGYSHSGKYNGELFDKGDLPYYGELLKTATLPLGRKAMSYDGDADQHGKINNPTVHIALNQLRKIINTLSDRYGAPAEINMELAREVKLGRKQNDEINKIIRKNTQENERIAEELAKLGIDNNSENRLKMKLWEELSEDPVSKCCVYCGKQISQAGLFGPDIHIEHILPKSRTYDDNVSNKTVAHLSCNSEKGERSPYEAFGGKTGKYDWQSICERANKLPANKRWRFQKDAMEQFANEDELLGRMLNDTRYMSRVASEYMQYVTGKLAIPVNGKLTEVLRRKWGLNQLLGESDIKERADHRHHAIDAFVIAMTDRVMVKRYADSVKRSKDRFLEKLPPPYASFSHDAMQEMINNIKVSFKPDQPNPSTLRGRNQTAGGLVKETAYSYIGPDPDNPKYGIYCVRQDVTSLTPKDIADIKDDTGFVKKRLSALWKSCGDDEKEFKAKLPAWAAQHNIKKVKLMLKANPDTMIPVRYKNGRIYKYYASDENLFADIYDKAKPGKEEPVWDMEIVSSYKAHLPEFKPEWKQKYPWAKLVMRLYKNDMVAFTNAEGKRELRRVRKMTYGIIYLRELNVAKKPKGKEDIGEAFTVNQLKVKNSCKAGVDEIGRFHDPARIKDAGDRAK